MPEAYITATRQYVAQANSWSLEELCLEVNVTAAQGASLDACSFGIKGQTRRQICSSWRDLRIIKNKCVQDKHYLSLRIIPSLHFYCPYLTTDVEHHRCSPRFETTRSNLCQQQAVSVHHHLHRSAPHSAPLDQAKHHREETHGKGSAA